MMGYELFSSGSGTCCGSQLDTIILRFIHSLRGLAIASASAFAVREQVSRRLRLLHLCDIKDKVRDADLGMKLVGRL